MPGDDNTTRPEPHDDRPASATPAEEDGQPGGARERDVPANTTDEEPDEIERWRQAGEEEEAGLPPPIDDGPLRTIPIRHLPLARDTHDGSPPSPHGPVTAPTPRAWQWVPLGALVALGIMMLLSAVVAAALPDAQAAVQTLGESVTGITDDAARMDALENALSGPQGEAIRRTVVGMLAAFVASLVLAGAFVGFVGRAGPLEAGLATGAFALLSLLFMGGGLSLYTLPTPVLAAGLGAAGGWLGAALRRRQDARRR